VNRLGIWFRSTLAVVVIVITLVAGTASSASASTNYSGTLTDGATWTAQVPDNWNGILLLASHGFGPPAIPPFGHLPPPIQNALLARGYAVAGSSYDPNGSWWALDSAARDQFETIGAFTAAVGEEPEHVLALGTSMGGLVSALMAEQGAGIIDGALSTCGIVGGAIHLNNYQLDAEYAIAKLLMTVPPKLVDFANPGEGAASGGALTAAVQAAQASPQGRARLSLVFALLNVVPVAPGVPEPAPNDAAAIEAAQYASAVQSFPVLNFVQFGRYWIELAAGGNGSWTRGEDFAELLNHSPYHDVVRELYRGAGLDLKTDLNSLNVGATIGANPDAIASLEETSVPTGKLEVPQLTLHTTADPLVPVQHESVYGGVVRGAGGNSLLRQAYVDRWGHCTFTPAELVASVEALRHRVETGRWDAVAQPQALQASASGLGLGDAAFVHYAPPALSGDNGSFDPARNGR
jgi:hypothetical protein